MIAPGTVLLHDNSATAGRSLLFENPERVLTTRDPVMALALIEEAETVLRDGWHVAGYLSYELGLCFEERLSPLLPGLSSRPLLWLGVFDAPRELTQAEAADWLKSQRSGDGAEISEVELGVSRADYGTAFRRVMDYIHAGDVYQINLTFPARFRVTGDPVALYLDLCRKQPVAHGAFVRTASETVLSLSPELFIESRAGRIVTRPMKGTIRRGRDAAEDEALKTSLHDDEKSRAENLMIVDLLRNDLGRVAEMGSVDVTRLFEVETYKSLHTMTSTIEAQLRPDACFGTILRALFPCGSVTGAPKIRAMQIIHELETGPRGIYCGSIGHAAPSGDFAWNVAIRTVRIDRDGQAEIGIGGGVVADSHADAEYDEALLKLKFLREPHAPFGLIETLRWDDSGFVLLERHLDRLDVSATFFEIGMDREHIRASLSAAVEGLPSPQRVRLVLHDTGELEITTAPLQPLERLRFVVADERMDTGDPLLRHKTTRRALYDAPRERAAEAYAVGEVVFLNERGELTEGSFTNLFVERGGKLVTPALSSGLLPGTLRAELIAGGRAEEGVLTLDDLETAARIFLGNSVRGLVPAEWVRP